MKIWEKNTGEIFEEFLSRERGTAAPSGY